MESLEPCKASRVIALDRRIKFEDLGSLPERLSSENAVDDLNTIFGKQNMSKKGFLPLSLFNLVRKELLLNTSYRFVMCLLSFLTPFLVKLFLEWVREPNAPQWDGYYLALSLFVCALVLSVAQEKQQWGGVEAAIRVRAALHGACFRKSLTMSSYDRQDYSVGAIANMQSVDTENIMVFLWLYSQDLWTCPFQITVVLFLLHHLMGFSALAGAAAIIVLMPLNAVLATGSGKWQERAMEQSDARMRAATEVLQGMKIIKLNAWERHFTSHLYDIRQKEMSHLRQSEFIVACSKTMGIVIPISVTLATFVVYTLVLKNELTPGVAFAAMALFGSLKSPLSTLPFSITAYNKFRISCKRIESFLGLPDSVSLEKPLLPPQLSPPQSPLSSWRLFGGGGSPKIGYHYQPIPTNDDTEDHHFTFPPPPLSQAKNEFLDDTDFDNNNKIALLQTGSVKISGDANFRWVQTTTISSKPQQSPKKSSKKGEKGGQLVLRNINLTVNPGELVMIIGGVGSGKTSLLKCFLGEIERVNGSVDVGGSIAYTAQQSWLMNATVRENILFGKELDEDLYLRTLFSCALVHDIQNLAAGDQTEVGEKGLNLSGGQKQRMSLARAVYQESDIYLFDDPLSAVDVHVGQHLMDHCILSLLSDKTRIMTTHQVQHLPRADKIVILEEGRIAFTGTYNQLLQSGFDFSEVTKSATSATSPSHSPRSPTMMSEDRQTTTAMSISDFQDCQTNSLTDTPSLLEGSTSESDCFSEPEGSSGGGSSGFVDVGTLSMKDLVGKSGGSASGALTSQEDSDPNNSTSNNSIPYRAYFSDALGTPLPFLFCLFVFALAQSVCMASDYWVVIWSESGPGEFKDFYAVAYCGMMACVAVFTLVKFAYVRSITLRIADSLHTKLLCGIARAPQSFFDTTPTGRIINRMSKDQERLDSNFPSIISDVLECSASVLSVLILLCILTPMAIAPLLVLGFVYQHIQKRYRRVASQLKGLEASTRSPAFSWLSETINGLITIRAFNQQNLFIEGMDKRVDANNVCFYGEYSVSKWLGMRLGCIGALLVFTGSAFAVLAKEGLGPGLVGLLLTTTLTLSANLSWLVRQFSKVEIQMNSVERVLAYANTPSEALWVVKEYRPPSDWPSQGSIEFNDVSIKYFPTSDPILKGVTCKIGPKEKIGIVGRTGAGKSTISLSLFRVLEAHSGSILIDGQDISRMGLHDLRGHLSIIPQEPVMFTGTMRSNLDPFGAHTDRELWYALERSHLKEFVANLPLKLDQPVSEGGDNFSVGQRQLLAIARALLRNSKILVMDEATASLDYNTDCLVKETVSTHFQHCTVLTIAHRLGTIMHSDRVMVLDKGRIVEFDSPATLLRDPSSVFYGLVRGAEAHHTNSLTD